MKKLLFLIFSIFAAFPSDGQIVKPKRHIFVNSGEIITPPPVTGAYLTIVGSDAITEGSSSTYTVIRTNTDNSTQDVTNTATFSSTKGSVSGKTVTNAANTLRGDNRRGTLTASYAGLTATKLITLVDATTALVAVSPRFATAADIAAYPFMQTGDFIIPGPTNVYTADQSQSIQLRVNFNNAPTIAPNRKMWIKGGQYSGVYISLANSRTTLANPVTISNYDGQVRIRAGIEINAGHGVVFTGKYDPVKKTGDPDYLGHDDTYTFSADRYGFLLDNEYTATANSAIRVDGYAKDIDISYIEIRGGWFAGTHFNGDNYDAGDNIHHPFSNINIHDLYQHDTHSEGTYWGSTGGGEKAEFENSSAYNNRFLRVGSEGIQMGQVNKGFNIYNNVVFSAWNWRSPFQPYQDNSLQLAVKQLGQVVENNLFIGCGSKHLNVFIKANLKAGYESTAGDKILIDNNAFLYNSGVTEGYFGTTEGLTIPNTTITVSNNVFGKGRFITNALFANDAVTAHALKFSIGGAGSVINVTNNISDNPTGIRTTWVSNDVPATTVNQSGNSFTATIAAPQFLNYMGLGDAFDYTRMESWHGKMGYNLTNYPDSITITGHTSLVTNVGQLITVPIGDIREHKGRFYRSNAINNTNIEPGVAANYLSYWDRIYWNLSTGAIVYNPVSLTGLSSIPPDDVSLVPGSFYENLGIGLINN